MLLMPAVGGYTVTRPFLLEQIRYARLSKPLDIAGDSFVRHAVFTLAFEQRSGLVAGLS
jgi:hypothetical protein